MAEHRNRNVIVVGVDGSPSSLQALRWAATQAERTGARLRAVTVWHMPTTYGWIPPVADFDWPGNARTTLEEAVKEALDPEQQARVERDVVEGHPASALARAAQGADLLVVGSRGREGFEGMLLGSVATHVLAHATCPVLVVPGGRDAQPAESGPSSS